ncbi:hypothetical protein TNCV_220041 [Trichonephila clavipes]|nr:hypothetical protein TNCV_220041 [Trichonephila clavipes]
MQNLPARIIIASADINSTPDLFEGVQQAFVRQYLEGHRGQKTCISRFASGHLKSLTFELGLRAFKISTENNAAEASPDHVLQCL